MTDEFFFSVDRLVEFGLSLTIAQQMIKSMNDSMSNMHIPGSMNSIKSEQSAFYYAIIDGNQTGPFSSVELFRLINQKKIVKETYLWKPGLSNWEIAQNLPEVLKLVAMTPPEFEGDI